MGTTWAAEAAGRNWWLVSLLVLALAGVVRVLVLFVGVLTNRDGALDRTVDRLTRLPPRIRPDRGRDELRHHQQFSAAAGVALLVAVAILLAGLLMDQLVPS